MKTLIIATRNTHKVHEIRSILSEGFDCLTLGDFPEAPPVVEDADTFSGNASKKSRETGGWISAHLPAELLEREVAILADDSGLEVDALDGRPGVHSARFAALDTGRPGNSPDAENNAKLLRLLAEVPEERRTARFRCVLALTTVWPHPGGKDAKTRFWEGTCDGRIAFAPSGKGGFGYDPLFIPDGYKLSFAELGEDIKNQLSHRAKALAKLRESLA
jgi:XTP/dITP diphosphohydrolase